jgi:hypothetical protein
MIYSLVYSSSLKMETIYSSQKSVEFYRSAIRHMPKESSSSWTTNATQSQSVEALNFVECLSVSTGVTSMMTSGFHVVLMGHFCLADVILTMKGKKI